MKLHRVLPCVAAATLLSLLTSCGGGSASSQSGAVSLTISPHISSIPVNTTITFTATPSNSATSWTLVGFAYGNLGSPNSSLASTFVYTAPPTPPIYTGAGAGANVPGTVTLQASAPGLAALTEVSDTETFVVTAPSITVGATPSTATVALGKTLQLTGYAVGSTNNGVTWTVNGVPGGSTATGTVVATSSTAYDAFVYTAPANMPMSGSTVTLLVTSTADPTKSASVIVTLQ